MHTQVGKYENLKKLLAQFAEQKWWISRRFLTQVHTLSTKKKEGKLWAYTEPYNAKVQIVYTINNISYKNVDN